ncbi:MAG: hypothetical protein A2233_04935 [Candidatus Kerfeldbacteria bacterium RIFOXYA2_FULL_38_24]|uniref:Methyltransferase domain-containing protein n=1 Tax=Candidatus Kerfeldbacteria bacterium RIFOXYB2_FULL_38_14 TaxID=1798547 RepID=A0A1G2BBK8_9BACT|nr:MAG: hypothetical protein A2233_04935 [Candidatus Kerfeldbacteria bacterium RIFOXYA2_FULL_38_24]OGY85670.1 MAG: hypothetical protein A2319_05205 [Candidatus Kerfeldbacteria bacterium RIFOXYB2_FULL_38_14]OGY88356.1 MAG: hypothetical protein A2458_02740 [Candidatus Kerfeldbacteria bacterium RIFOXYC2_FULL_38_9]
MKTKIFTNLVDVYELWRETTLEKKHNEIRETEFIKKIFHQQTSTIQNVIDLGGGIGLHANLLETNGYDSTVFDQSKKALSIAKKKNVNIQTVCGSFEQIHLAKQYDAAICMWSTLSYIHTEKGRVHFYQWMNKNIRKIIILEQANFYRYPATFHKVYYGENNQHTIKITRNWQLNKKNIKNTQYRYEIYSKKKHTIRIIKDAEKEHYLSVDQLKKYLGDTWHLRYLLGDYSLSEKYNKNSSKRMIAVFYR